MLENRDLWDLCEDESVINLQDFVQKLREDRTFVKDYLKLWPQNEADVIGFIDNPKCRCAGNLVNFHHEHIEETQKMSINLFSSEVFIVPPRMIVGEFTRVPFKDGQNYKKLIQFLNDSKWVYRGASVSIVGSDLLVFFW